MPVCVWRTEDCKGESGYGHKHLPCVYDCVSEGVRARVCVHVCASVFIRECMQRVLSAMKSHMFSQFLLLSLSPPLSADQSAAASKNDPRLQIEIASSFRDSELKHQRQESERVGERERER